MQAAAAYALIFAIFLPFLATRGEPNSTGSGEVSSAASNCEALQSGQASDDQALLCYVYESSALLAQLGTLLNEGIDRLAIIQGLINASSGEAREKRKHEYLRFGKRKHEYLRFGKRKHEYLRFG